MRLTKVPRYSATELERRAETLLRDRCGWPPTIPVDIESLVDQGLDVAARRPTRTLLFRNI